MVTGASQGIGRVIAKTLAAEGAEVIVNCAHSPAKAQAVADEIIAAGGKASVYVCDVSDEAAVKQMFAKLSPIHYLVNNARVDPYFRKPEMLNGDWFSLVMDINLKGAYLCSMSFFEQAKLLAGSCIVNISSVRAFTPAEMHVSSSPPLPSPSVSPSRYPQGLEQRLTDNKSAQGSDLGWRHAFMSHV